MRILLAPFRFLGWLLRVIFNWFKNLGASFQEFFSEEPEDAPLPEAFAKTVENPLGLLVHLDALRKHLVRAVIVLALATALSFAFQERLLAFLSTPLEGGIKSLVAIEPTEPIGTVMRVALLSGFTLTFPYIALEIWLFIGPGVSRKTRIAGLIAIPLATVFFLAGMAFAFFVMTPAALDFLLNFSGFATELRPASYFRFITSLVFWIGLFFEFPLVIYMLASIGLVKGRVLLQQWRLAVVIVAIIAAMITPTVDPVNMSLVMGPMIILYFLGIGLAFFAQRGRPASA